MTEELLELLWVLEHTIDALPQLDQLLDDLTSAPVVTGDDLPIPTDDERQPPDAPATPGTAGQTALDVT